MKMVFDKEAQQLVEKFIKIRKRYDKKGSENDLVVLQKLEQQCVEKFKYLVISRAGKYQHFPNYEDLIQDGLEALIKAMKNYNPNKSPFFWWAKKYVDTRIARSANLHTTIRYPLKYTKDHKPHKESVLPVIIDTSLDPNKSFERSETINLIKNALTHLNKEQKELVMLAYGFDGDKPMSINKICKKKRITRMYCVKTLHEALSLMKANIKL